MRRLVPLRWLLCAAAPLCLLATLRGLRSESDPLQSVRTLTPDVPYAMRVESGITTLDLPAAPDVVDRLIIASLADSGPHTVQFAWSTTNAPQPLPVSRWPGVATHSALPDAATSLATAPISPALPRVAPTDSVPGERDFFLHVTEGPLDDPAQYARISARLVASGHRVRVWLDRNAPLDSHAQHLAREVISEGDRLLPELEATLAPLRDVDGDGRLAVLLTPWLDRLQGGQTSLGGFVRSTDFRATLPAPLSNRADILYLNPNLSAGASLTTLLAHELTHACALAPRLSTPRAPHGLADEEDWISEGIAHLAEVRFGDGSNIEHREARFLADPASYPLVVRDYYGAGLWRNHGCRGATWSFHRWCMTTFGDDALRRLIDGPHTGSRNLERSTGVPFADLFRSWTLSLLNEQSDPVRITGWSDPAKPFCLSIAPTAAAFIELPATDDSQLVRRLHITADPSARLQVTLVRVSAARRTLQVRGQWTLPRLAGRDGSAAPPETALNVSADAGASATIDSVTLQRFTQTEMRAIRFDHPDLATLLYRDPSRESRVRLGRSVRPEPDRAWLLRVESHDENGHRRIGWSELPTTGAW